MDNYNRLLSPVFSSGQAIHFLPYLTMETVALHSGLYPLIHSKFIYHQLVCIVGNIINVGPLRVTWTYPPA
jgi:hypothetical protein